jgi:hypothetical protein
MWQSVANWLRTYESVAIWLEGIALVLIFIWDRLDSRQQHRETLVQSKVSQQQVEAAKVAALATKESADILAALHRPFISLSGVSLKTGLGTRSWEIAFGIKNYGTLPAVGVGFSARVFIDDVQRVQHTNPASFQIFPSSEFEALLGVDWGEPDKEAIHSETKKIRINVHIPYQTENGNKFTFTAEVCYKQGRFNTLKSSTELG